MRHPSDPATDDALPDATGMRVAIVVARFNDTVTTRLRDGAIEALTVAGAAVDAIETFDVPGAFEVLLRFAAAEPLRAPPLACASPTGASSLEA